MQFLEIENRMAILKDENENEKMEMEMKMNLVCFISEKVVLFEKVAVLCVNLDQFLKSC